MRQLPVSDGFNLIEQMRRASTSVVVNISEGSSRKSQTERDRCDEMARGSVIEIDSCCDLIGEENFVAIENLEELGKKIKKPSFYGVI
ncbi:four helix bundle protein [Chryseobacterium koreense]